MDTPDPQEIVLLVVDDEASVRESLGAWFRDDGYTVHTAANAAEALRVLQDRHIDIIILDVRMPGMDGLALQDRIREFDADIIIIILTAFASVDTAVRALKAGAFDYATKPIDPDELTTLVRNASAQVRLRRENLALRDRLETLQLSDEIIGDSPAMHQVFDLIRTVAPTDSTVLIRGESGTGKELVARAIHMNSRRKYFPIIPVNCGALSESLLESELFGHERGAFTGAQYRRKGKFEMAKGGTLFLDEVGTLSLKSQIDLLRVLDTHQFHRVGGEQLVSSDFRLICATNADLEKDVAEGRFREDLYYRINVFSITIPPLRERAEDIPLLAAHFVRTSAAAMNRQPKDIAPRALEMLRTHAWPGNVRELENAMERAMVVCRSARIEAGDLPLAQAADTAEAPVPDSLEEMERRHIERMLADTNWNISRTAERLRIDRVTLYRKMEKYGIARPE